MLDRITPLILTRDEERNIERTLGQLAWAAEVIVIDSFSTDTTVEIASRFPNVRVLQRTFDTHAAQWTFGVDQVHTEWVLTLDADYFVSDTLVRELAALDPPHDIVAYEAAFTYAVGGRPLRASLYPPRPVLLRRGSFRTYQDGHTQRFDVSSGIGRLREHIVHDDRKSLRRFIERQRIYMRQEAAKLRSTPWRELNASGRVRRLRVVAPFAAFGYSLLIKRTFLDGRAGLRYAFERFLAEAILSRELLRRREPPASGR